MGHRTGALSVLGGAVFVGAMALATVSACGTTDITNVYEVAPDGGIDARVDAGGGPRTDADAAGNAPDVGEVDVSIDAGSPEGSPLADGGSPESTPEASPSPADGEPCDAGGCAMNDSSEELCTNGEFYGCTPLPSFACPEGIIGLACLGTAFSGAFTCSRPSVGSGVLGCIAVDGGPPDTFCCGLNDQVAPDESVFCPTDGGIWRDPCLP